MKYNFFVTSDRFSWRHGCVTPLYSIFSWHRRCACPDEERSDRTRDHSLVQLVFHGGGKKLAQSLKTEPVLRRLFSKPVFILLFFLLIASSSFAQKATWIWYP